MRYKGYKITTRLSDDWTTAEAAVFDLRFPRSSALYETTSLDLAMRWVDSYRAGAQWAVDAVLARANDNQPAR